jgi:aryl carrier-like protein
MADGNAPTDKLRTALHGMPPAAIAAAEEFRVTGNRAAFDRAVVELVEYHLSPRPPRPLSTYPGATALVAELGLDSLTMVELLFLFEDAFGVKVPQEKLSAVVTLDDLRALLHAHLPPAASA